MEIDKCFLNVCEALERNSHTIERMAKEQLKMTHSKNGNPTFNNKYSNDGDNKRIEDVGLSERACSILKDNGITTLDELKRLRRHDFYSFKKGARKTGKIAHEIEAFLYTKCNVKWYEDVRENEPTVTYISLTKEQIYDFAKEVAKNVLMEFGVEFDKEQAKFTPDTKNEYMPLEFWLKKLNVNRSTVWRWQKQGLVTPRYIGKKVFFRQIDFDECFNKAKK